MVKSVSMQCTFVGRLFHVKIGKQLYLVLITVCGGNFWPDLNSLTTDAINGIEGISDKLRLGFQSSQNVLFFFLNWRVNKFFDTDKLLPWTTHMIRHQGLVAWRQRPWRPGQQLVGTIVRIWAKTRTMIEISKTYFCQLDLDFGIQIIDLHITGSKTTLAHVALGCWMETC